jgi:hypothetical protein
MTLTDKEKIDAIWKVLDDYPKHIFNRKGAVKDFERALQKIKRIMEWSAHSDVPLWSDEK